MTETATSKLQRLGSGLNLGEPTPKASDARKQRLQEKRQHSPPRKRTKHCPGAIPSPTLPNQLIRRLRELGIPSQSPRLPNLAYQLPHKMWKQLEKMMYHQALQKDSLEGAGSLRGSFNIPKLSKIPYQDTYRLWNKKVSRIFLKISMSPIPRNYSIYSLPQNCTLNGQTDQ